MLTRQHGFTRVDAEARPADWVECLDKLHRELGWQPRHGFEAGLATTVQWYLDHRGWWERVLSEAYRTAAAMYLAER